MDFAVVVPSVPYIGSVLVVGLFLWRVLGRQLADFKDRFDRVDDRFDRVDDRFDRVDDRFERVEGRIGGMDVRVGTLEAAVRALDAKVDGLARDHQRLATDLSEFRGEMRGRLSVLAMPNTGDGGATA